jgi:hypothetical protein
MTIVRSLTAMLVLLSGCAAPSGNQAAPVLPDARELSEHPLDVVSLPQP